MSFRLLPAAFFWFCLPLIAQVRQPLAPADERSPELSVRPIVPIRPPSAKTPAPKDQGVEGGFWHIDRNYDPIFRLKNVLLTQSLDVAPSIFMADGTEYKLPVVHLEAAGVAQINIRYALKDAPPSIQAHMSQYGMLGAGYRWGWPALIATVENQDEIASLDNGNAAQADTARVHAAVPGDESEQAIRGTWSVPTPNADQYVSLQNPSLTGKTVEVEIADGKGSKLASRSVSLPVHATALYRISEILGSKPPVAGDGEVTIRYHGVARGVLASSSIEDDTVGYSSTPHFVEQHQDLTKPIHAVTIEAPGLMVGRPEPPMQFTEGTVFTPFTMLHNISSHALTASISMTWDGPLGRPRTLTVGRIALAAGQSQTVSYEAFLRKAPVPDGYAHISIDYEGREGDLITDIGSVDQTGNYVFEVAPSIAAQTLGKIICFWELQGTRNTMFSVWNYTSGAQDFELKLLYSGGQYRIPIHLDAGKAYNMDLMSLVRSRVPDADGSLIPSNITSGSAMLTGPGGEGQTISVASTSATFSPEIQDCHVNCIDCTTGAVVSFTDDWPDVGVGDSVQYTPVETLNTGTQVTPASGTWAMSNSYATVNGTGKVTGMSAGATEVSYTTSVPYDIVACGDEQCPWEPVTVTVPTNVVTISLSPSDISMSNGDTTVVLNVQVTPAGAAGGEVSPVAASQSNPFSSSLASVSFTAPSKFTGNDPWTINVSGSNSPSGVFATNACFDDACSTNSTNITIPPQVLIQMMYAEANGTGNQTAMASLGETIQNRFNSSYFTPDGYTTWQNSLIIGQVAINPTVTTGVQPELNAAVNVFTVNNGGWCGALAWWSPTAGEWSIVQAAIQSGTSIFPAGTGSPQFGAFTSSIQQILYDPAVGTSSSGAPNFLYLAPRPASYPAAVSVSCL